jgi:hypothetical protein
MYFFTHFSWLSESSQDCSARTRVGIRKERAELAQKVKTKTMINGTLNFRFFTTPPKVLSRNYQNHIKEIKITSLKIEISGLLA